VLKYVQSVEDNGFAIVRQCLAEQMVEHLCSQLGYAKHSQRNLLGVPVVRELAASEPVKQLTAALLGKDCFAVRGILFNKTPDANWKVVWHQDRTIAVRERKDVALFGPWSMKATKATGRFVSSPAHTRQVICRLMKSRVGENDRALPASFQEAVQC
jgi:hypothetical protein